MQFLVSAFARRLPRHAVELVLDLPIVGMRRGYLIEADGTFPGATP
jgi:hypothetical protein